MGWGRGGSVPSPFSSSGRKGPRCTLGLHSRRSLLRAPLCPSTALLGVLAQLWAPASSLRLSSPLPLNSRSIPTTPVVFKVRFGLWIIWEKQVDNLCFLSLFPDWTLPGVGIWSSYSFHLQKIYRLQVLKTLIIGCSFQPHHLTKSSTW